MQRWMPIQGECAMERNSLLQETCRSAGVIFLAEKDHVEEVRA